MSREELLRVEIASCRSIIAHAIDQLESPDYGGAVSTATLEEMKRVLKGCPHSAALLERCESCGYQTSDIGELRDVCGKCFRSLEIRKGLKLNGTVHVPEWGQPAPAEVTAEHFAAKLTLGIQNMATADVPNGAGHMESWIRKSDVLRLLAAAKGGRG